MKTFKAPNWDSDAEGDYTCKELFKDSLNRKKKNRSKVISEDHERQKRLKKMLRRQFKDFKSNDVNVITVQTKIELGNTQRKQDNSSTGGFETLRREKKPRKKCKKSKAEISSDSEDYEGAVTKKQKKMLRKYSSEINNLKDDSDKLSEEWSIERKRQKKLKRKLEKAAKKHMLRKVMDTKIKDRLGYLDVKKIKTEPSDDPGPSCSTMVHNRIIKQEKEKTSSDIDIPRSLKLVKQIKLQEKLKTILLNQVETRKEKPIMTLRQKMMEKLKAARFRFLNEQIYKTDSKEAQRIFKSDPEAFTAYHEGYQQQVKSWPLNPLDVIIRDIRKMPKTHVVADFGCGDAKLARCVQQKVHSFDLVAVNHNVVACDMANVPLSDASVDVAVFCLSLMGTNLRDYLLEANRVLKLGGILKIAEVESRFEKVETFIEGVQHFGFRKTWKDLSNNLFYFMDFRKVVNVKNKKKLPTISLLPCLYKKR